MEKQKTIKRKANAKINLFLETLGKRIDGYTEIKTIFTEIPLFDELTFILTKKNEIKILTENFNLPEKNNLIYKVAIFIKNKYRVNKGVEIKLKKNIPVAAGLGGGSSDAAQTILAINELWDLNLSKEDINYIASRFGSDINFFLEGGFAKAFGRGEIIEKLNSFPLGDILLVNPNLEISAKEAYGLVDNNHNINDWNILLKTKDVKFCFNRLERAVVEKYSKVKDCIETFKRNNFRNAIMSGSGSTVIGFISSESDVGKTVEYFKSLNYWIKLIKN